MAQIKNKKETLKQKRKNKGSNYKIKPGQFKNLAFGS